MDDVVAVEDIHVYGGMREMAQGPVCKNDVK